ncbi:hypothetical protein ACZ90_40705 [Streptomyces albus subsp. albus]|nr:hypothetical protein ACZ90_40705 [Streptomyces albus subsp. albus]
MGFDPRVVRGAGQDDRHDERNDLARCPQSIAFGGYHVVLTRGLSPEELADRLAATVRYDAEHTAVAVGEHTGASLLELMDDTYGDSMDGIGLRLGRAGDWTFAVAYGGWQGEFGPLAPVSRGGAHICFLDAPIVNGTLPAVLLEPA